MRASELRASFLVHSIWDSFFVKLYNIWVSLCLGSPVLRTEHCSFPLSSPLCNIASWSKVSASTSSQQSTLQSIITKQRSSPPWIAVAVRLIHRREGKSTFNPKKSIESNLWALVLLVNDAGSEQNPGRVKVFMPPEGSAPHTTLCSRAAALPTCQKKKKKSLCFVLMERSLVAETAF